jgi:energy-converting hydrogenase Eha subunit F
VDLPGGILTAHLYYDDSIDVLMSIQIIAVSAPLNLLTPNTN